MFRWISRSSTEILYTANVSQLEKKMVIHWQTFAIACLYTCIANRRSHRFTGKHLWWMNRENWECLPSKVLPYTVLQLKGLVRTVVIKLIQLWYGVAQLSSISYGEYHIGVVCQYMYVHLVFVTLLFWTYVIIMMKILITKEIIMHLYTMKTRSKSSVP